MSEETALPPPQWPITDSMLQVIRCCGLIEDLQRLPEGDLTVVKKGGENLSGGQRQRIGLARAVHKNASIYLLDDPLSAIDPCLRQKIFDQVCESLSSRTLLTDMLHQL